MAKKITFILITLMYLVSYGQNSLSDFLAIAPISLFDNTTEGISHEEIEHLVSKGESTSWKISFQGDKKMIISCKYPFSEVTLFLLNNSDSSLTLVSYTENERISTLETWKKNNSNVLEKIDLLPSVYARDFFLEENQFKGISKYNERVYYYLDVETLTIRAGFNIWMLEHFDENKSTDYDISLKWNGTAFKILKSK